MKEQDGAFHFDLNHLATFQYKHLGEDIGYGEAKTKCAALQQLISSVLEKPQVDSPVFTFLKEVQGRVMSAEELGEQMDAAESYGRAQAPRRLGDFDFRDWQGLRAKPVREAA